MHLICPSPLPLPLIRHNLCFSFLVGIIAVPRGIENNAYANSFFGGGEGEQITGIMRNLEVANIERGQLRDTFRLQFSSLFLSG